jgi:hypothetical protein
MHELFPMPQTSSEFIWWAFQIAFLALVYFMKRDLGEIKADGKANREMNETNKSEIAKQSAVCEERHRRLDLEIAGMRHRNTRVDE